MAQEEERASPGPDSWLRRHGPAGPDALPPLLVAEGLGAEFRDEKGRTFLDLASGNDVPLGYGHPAAAAALLRAGARGGIPGVDWPETAALMHKLAELAPGGTNRRVLICESGREALARAVTLAQRTTGRTRVLYLSDCKGKPDIGRDAAAVVVHPLDQRLKLAREQCDETGALLVDDETGIGPGMTGRFFAAEAEGVRPDVYVLGRGWAAGLAFGACITGSSTLRWETRPAGNPLGAAVALAVIGVLEAGLLEGVGRLSARMEERLRGLARFEKAGAGCGQGLFWTMLFPEGTATATALAALCREKGLLLRPISADSLGVRPPLVVTREQVDRGFDIIEQGLGTLGRGRR